MNGRVYDPMLGRFLSADPYVDDAGDSQSYNRYSYVSNNPLNHTDPSGFFKLKDALKIVAIVVIAYFTAGWGATLAGTMGITSTVGTAMVAGAVSGFSSAFAGSLLNGASIGDAFKAGAIGALSGAITGGLLAKIGDAGIGGFSKALAHGTVLGAAEEATGGEFRHGFYSGFFTASVSGQINEIGNKGQSWGRAARVAASAVVGGTASVIGGGKFANGAVAGAFSRMFNDELHDKIRKDARDKVASGSLDKVKRVVLLEGGVADEDAYTAWRVDSQLLARENGIKIETIIDTFNTPEELEALAKLYRSNLGDDAKLLVEVHGAGWPESQSRIGEKTYSDKFVRELVGRTGWAESSLVINHCEGLGGIIGRYTYQFANDYRESVGSKYRWKDTGKDIRLVPAGK